MRGTMLIYRPRGAGASIIPLSKPLDHEEMGKIVAGFLELVPGFDIVRYGDRDQPCVAFCNEDGIRLQLMPNLHASHAWWFALQNKKLVGGELLMGNVIVLFGDQEFMEEL